MGFDNTQFPDDIGYGSRGGPGFKTSIIELKSGKEERAGRWAQPRHRYDVSYGIRTYDDLMTVKSFFMARQGALQSFKFKDWQDYATNATHVLFRSTDVATAGDDQSMQRISDSVLGLGDGVETEFQLVKVYTDGVSNFTRKISKPVSGTLAVEVNAVAVTEGVDYNVNYQTGVVTFTTAPPDTQTVTWGGSFDVEVRFDASTDEWLSTTHDDFSNGSLSGIGLVELTDSTPVTERYWHGGVKDHGSQTGTTVQINQADGRLHRIDPQDGSVVAQIQRVDDLDTGENQFHIQNASSSFTIAIETTDGTTLDTLATDGICEILVTDDGSGGKTLISFQ